MTMTVLSIPIPETLPQALKMSDDEFSQEARILLAAKLYELGKVSGGVAAINLKDEEVAYEIEAARRLASE
jgi:hypothetical protein